MSRYLGLRIGFAGFCIAVVFAGFAFLFDSKLPVIGCFFGWLVGVCGLGVHFYLMFKHRRRR